MIMPYKLYAGFKLLYKSSLAKKSKISQTFDISAFYLMSCFVLSLFSHIYFASLVLPVQSDNLNP